MISIADIPFSRVPQEENINFEPSRYQSDLLHYIRKKQPRKVRTVKNFLDRNLQNPDQDAQGIDKDLSRIYGRFCDEQTLRYNLLNQDSDTS